MICQKFGFITNIFYKIFNRNVSKSLYISNSGFNYVFGYGEKAFKSLIGNLGETSIYHLIHVILTIMPCTFHTRLPLSQYLHSPSHLSPSTTTTYTAHHHLHNIIQTSTVISATTAFEQQPERDKVRLVGGNGDGKYEVTE